MQLKSNTSHHSDIKRFDSETLTFVLLNSAPMANKKGKLPKIGESAPSFVAQTQKGTIHFPEDFRGSWCVFFCHPANFTSGWRMYSDYLAQKERWLQERNTRLLMLSNQTVSGELWKDLVSRYLSFHFKAPIIEDTDNRIADLYGMSPSQRIAPPNHRFLYIVDPEGIIRLIVCRPLPSMQQSLNHIADELEKLQTSYSKAREDQKAMPLAPPFQPPEERLDEGINMQKLRPAYLRTSKTDLN